MTTFIDTNVLVYAHDRSGGTRRDQARSVLLELWDQRQGVLSTQVLQEFYVTVTRKLARPVAKSAARRVVAAYAAWPVQTVSAGDVLEASELEERHRLAFWDALIVVSAQRCGAERLLSEDMQHGRTLLGVRIENPFA